MVSKNSTKCLLAPTESAVMGIFVETINTILQDVSSKVHYKT